MSLLKMPILLSSVWLFNVSFMCPNASPNKSERVLGAWYEYIFPITFPLLHRISASIPCLAELAVLLAIQHPSTFSSHVLARLVLTNDLPTVHANPVFLLGSVIATIGGLGRLSCFRALGHHFTHHVTIRKDHQLVTTGPYAIVRHPGYMFGHLSGFGMSLMIASPGSFIHRCGWAKTAFGRTVIGVWAMQNVLGWVLSYLRCSNEDAILRERFGEEWERYAKKVKYRMVPGVY